MPWVEPIARRAAWITIAGIIVAFLVLASKVFIPLALGMLLAFLLTPIVERVAKIIRSRVAAVAVTCTLAFGLLVGAGFIVGQQMYDFASQFDGYQNTITHKLLSLRDNKENVFRKFLTSINKIQHDVAATTAPSANTQKVELVGSAESSGPISSFAAVLGPLFEPGALFCFAALLTVMLLLHGPDLRDRVLVLAGTQQISMTTQALEEAAERIGRYLLSQALVNTIFGVLIAGGLMLIGVPNALLFGCLAGVLRFIPVIGPWLGATMPLLLSFAVFDQWRPMFYVVGLFAGVELGLNFALEPWIYGSSTGISGIAVVVALLFWTWVWGSVGLLLAIPMTVCLVVIGKYVEPLRIFYILFSDEQVLSGDRRLYHRLVCGDLGSADEIVSKSVTEIGAAATSDQLLLPVVLTARSDLERGVLAEGRYRLVADSLDALSPKLEEAAVTGTPTIACVAVEAHDQLTAHIVTSAVMTMTNEPLAILDNLMLSELSERICAGNISTLILISTAPDSFARARLLAKGLLARVKNLKLMVLDVAHIARLYPWDAAINVTLCDSVAEVVEKVQQIQRERVGLEHLETTIEPAVVPAALVAT